MPISPNTRARPFMAMAFSLLIGLLVLIYPLSIYQEWQRPLWLVVVMLFWALYQPRYMGLGAAFALGLVVDIVSQGRLGQHSILFVLLLFWVSLCRHYWYLLAGWRVWLVALTAIVLASGAHYLWIAPTVLSDSVSAPTLIQAITINVVVNMGGWLVMMLLFSRYRRAPNDDD